MNNHNIFEFLFRKYPVIEKSRLDEFCYKCKTTIDTFPNSEKIRLENAHSILLCICLFYHSLDLHGQIVTPAIDLHGFWLRILLLHLNFKIQDLGSLAYSPINIPTEELESVKIILRELTLSEVGVVEETSLIIKSKAAFGVSAIDHKDVLKRIWA